MIWKNLEQRARELLAKAERSVLLVAPFVKEAVLSDLLNSVAPGVSVQLYTRWRADEVAMGVSETAVLPLVEARGGSVYLIDDLHAKLLAVDFARGLMGSANMTAAGLGMNLRPNLELMCEVGDPKMLAPFLAELRRRSRLATIDEATRVEKAAACVRRALPDRQPPDADSPSGERLRECWIPRFRSPDRLFVLYSDPEWLQSASPADPALADLADLRPPSGLTLPGFITHVRLALLDSPATRVVDRLLANPQRFGEISSGLREVLPEATHRERQTTAQTLIRWLLYFASDRYGIRTPNYSEILFRR